MRRDDVLFLLDYVSDLIRQLLATVDIIDPASTLRAQALGEMLDDIARLRTEVDTCSWARLVQISDGAHALCDAAEQSLTAR